MFEFLGWIVAAIIWFVGIFLASAYVGEMGNSKKGYRFKGPNFTLFFVLCWPVVLLYALIPALISKAWKSILRAVRWWFRMSPL